MSVYETPTDRGGGGGFPCPPGGCFNKHNELSDRATDHYAMDKLHGMMVHRPVNKHNSPSCLLKQPPGGQGQAQSLTKVTGVTVLEQCRPSV